MHQQGPRGILANSLRPCTPALREYTDCPIDREYPK